MSNSPAGNIADLNHDERVDLSDWSLFSQKWLWAEILLAEDLNRNNLVGLEDLEIFQLHWLWQKPLP